MEREKWSKWTKEEVLKEALKYTKKSTFRRYSHSAAESAVRNNWFDEACAHMKIFRVNNRTIEECMEVASRYKTMSDFKTNECGVHLYCKRRGWLHKVTPHMKKYKKWGDRKEEVHQVALKYQNRGEFSLKDERHYEVARRWGWLDDVCGHMISIGNKYKRLVYVYEFEDKSVYVGLTGNDNKRSTTHGSSKNSPVFKHQQKYNLTPTKLIITNGYIDSEEAKKIECDTVEKYNNEGWNVLNKAKAGGLGGSDRIWTEERIIETISKYRYESDLRKNEPKLINKLYSLKKIDEYLKLVIKDTPTYWNEELVKELVSKYTHFKDFSENNKGARGWVYRNKRHDLLKGLINLNKEKSVIKKWANKDEILLKAAEYNNITEFQRNNIGMYRSAVMQGWLDDVRKVVRPKFLWTKDKVIEIANRYDNYKTFRKENRGASDAVSKYGWWDCLSHLKRDAIYWTVDMAKKEALKYNHRSEFCKNSAGAYYFLKNNGIFDESTSHMIRLNNKGHKKQQHKCSVCGEMVAGESNIKRWHEGNCKPDRPHSKKNKRKFN